MENLAEKCFDESIIQEALANFSALLESVDFEQTLEMMGIGRFQFMRRRQMLIEWRGLYMALWRLALQSSFPQDAEHMFSTFLQGYASAHPDKTSRYCVERATEYWGMLQLKGLNDFTEVARHLCSFVIQTDKGLSSLTMKVILHIRKAYSTIFDALI